MKPPSLEIAKTVVFAAFHHLFVARTKRKPCKKFQVDICKTKKDRSAHAQLRQAMIYNAARVRRLSTKLQADSGTCKTKKKIDLCMYSCSPCSGDPSHDL